ncbi:hypothetical protein LF95_22025 [Thalassospira sp. TSL5-1]|nr:hypothetical protein LF95_22025 [Thalassospira sp. TSL5-1]
MHLKISPYPRSLRKPAPHGSGEQALVDSEAKNHSLLPAFCHSRQQKAAPAFKDCLFYAVRPGHPETGTAKHTLSV